MQFEVPVSDLNQTHLFPKLEVPPQILVDKVETYHTIHHIQYIKQQASPCLYQIQYTLNAHAKKDADLGLFYDVIL